MMIKTTIYNKSSFFSLGVFYVVNEKLSCLIDIATCADINLFIFVNLSCVICRNELVQYGGICIDLFNFYTPVVFIDFVTIFDSPYNIET